MPSLSVVIPTLRIGDCFEKCLTSFEGEYDQLVIVDEKLDNLAKKINKGLAQATGDFIIVSNDDVELTRGHLKDLCREEQVVSPVIGDAFPWKTFHAHLWCMPREVYEKVGGWAEYYDGWYYDDADYWMRLLEAGYNPTVTSEVNIAHNHPGTTLGTFNNGDRIAKNRQIFIDKWGYQALAITGNA